LVSKEFFREKNSTLKNNGLCCERKRGPSLKKENFKRNLTYISLGERSNSFAVGSIS